MRLRFRDYLFYRNINEKMKGFFLKNSRGFLKKNPVQLCGGDGAGEDLSGSCQWSLMCDLMLNGINPV